MLLVIKDLVDCWCSAAYQNDTETLQAWRLAGANLKTPDYAGNTAYTVVHNEIIFFEANDYK